MAYTHAPLQTIYADFGLVTSEANAEVLDEELHEYLQYEDEHPQSAFSTGEKLDMISVYDQH